MKEWNALAVLRSKRVARCLFDPLVVVDDDDDGNNNADLQMGFSKR